MWPLGLRTWVVQGLPCFWDSRTACASIRDELAEVRLVLRPVWTADIVRIKALPQGGRGAGLRERTLPKTTRRPVGDSKLGRAAREASSLRICGGQADIPSPRHHIRRRAPDTGPLKRGRCLHGCMGEMDESRNVGVYVHACTQILSSADSCAMTRSYVQRRRARCAPSSSCRKLSYFSPLHQTVGAAPRHLLQHRRFPWWCGVRNNGC